VGWRKYGRKLLAQGRGSPFPNNPAVAMYYKCSQPNCIAKEVVMIPGTLETLEAVLRGLEEPGDSVVKVIAGHNHEVTPQADALKVSFKGTQKIRKPKKPAEEVVAVNAVKKAVVKAEAPALETAASAVAPNMTAPNLASTAVPNVEVPNMPSSAVVASYVAPNTTESRMAAAPNETASNAAMPAMPAMLALHVKPNDEQARMQDATKSCVGSIPPNDTLNTEAPNGHSYTAAPGELNETDHLGILGNNLFDLDSVGIDVDDLHSIGMNSDALDELSRFTSMH